MAIKQGIVKGFSKITNGVETKFKVFVQIPVKSKDLADGFFEIRVCYLDTLPANFAKSQVDFDTVSRTIVLK